MAANIEAGESWFVFNPEGNKTQKADGMMVPSKGSQHFFNGQNFIWVKSDDGLTDVGTLEPNVILNGKVQVTLPSKMSGFEEGIYPNGHYQLIGDGSYLKIGKYGETNHIKISHEGFQTEFGGR